MRSRRRENADGLLAISVAGSLAWAVPHAPAWAQQPPVPGYQPAVTPYTPFATASVGAGLRVRAIAEIGNEPTVPGGADSDERFKSQLGALGLSNLQITARMPFLELSAEQALIPGVGVRLSGELSQVLRDPVTNPDLEEAFQKRQEWRLGGGWGQRPLYVPQLKDAYMTLGDPERSGGLQMGQFRVPFGYERFSTAFPPLAVAPEETPMTDVLGSLGGESYRDYQPSTLSWRHDIGLMIFGRSGDAGFHAGVLNGSGPNRVDDNADKDFFLRLDWQPNRVGQIGASALVGNDLGYKGGLGPQSQPIKVFRRNYGVHGRLALLRFLLQGEWIDAFSYSTEPDKEFEAEPRRGWYLDLAGAVTELDRVFVQYGNFSDPRTPEGRPYLSHQVAVGAVHLFAPGLSWRTEYQHRWEYLGALPNYLEAQYGKYLTSLEWSL